MIYSELRSQIVRNLQNRDDAVTAALIMSTFNFVQKYLAREGDWDALQAVLAGRTLTRGVASYTYTGALPAIPLPRFKKIYSFRVNAGTSWNPPLSFLTPLDYDIKVAPASTSITGVPSIYTAFGGSFHLSPTPAAAYAFEIKFYQYPEVITSDLSPITLTDIDQILVSATTAYCLLALGELQASNVWFQLANRELKTWLGDTRHSFGFEPSLKVLNRGGATGQFWADPFVTRNP
ncbi:MAG: hypothetical protein DDT18_00977 [Actinobacteria bacterium]|nr:hypothetical protein [Actinomycetota bacterium]